MRKIAILFGNNEYESGTDLQCSVNDAKDLSKKLQILGFETECVLNTAGNDMGLKLAAFENKLPNYDVGLFFFAGHGFQFDGKNYLATVETSFSDRRSAAYTSFDLDRVIEGLTRSDLSIKILIIDACRNGTFPGERGGNVGFAPVFAPRGTIIAFGTSPGQAALENEHHGLFTGALLQHVMTENLTIENMFKRVRNTVYVLSGSRQITWEHTSLMGEFYFNKDSIDDAQKLFYSQAALADSDYECEEDSVLEGIITDLKSCDWNYQNPVISAMNKIKWSQTKKNDLFILGRNLYQASNAAFAVSSYFENLYGNLIRIGVNVSKHILAGMVYEIYFNSKGKLRNHLKVEKYEEVIKTILHQEFLETRLFIRDQLKGYNQKVMFIPGETEKIVFDVVIQSSSDRTEYYLKSISLDGQNILYNPEGTELYDHSNSGYTNGLHLHDLKSKFQNELAIPKQRLEVNYSCNFASNELNEDIRIEIPYEFNLLRYAK